MKTSVEISDFLFQQAKLLARREHTTMRALIEEGLRRLIAERKAPKPFKLRRVTFRGKGLQTRMAGAGWKAIRAAIYEERGADRRCASAIVTLPAVNPASHSRSMFPRNLA